MKILRFFAFTILILLASQTTTLALKVNCCYIQDSKLFGIQFPDGSSYYGYADSLVAVSKQRYMVGPLVVTEVNIELDSSPVQLRIYHSRALSSQNATALANKKAGVASNFVPQLPMVMDKIDAETKQLTTQQNVYKDYPTTTHARTLEFIVPNLEELEEFFKELHEHFIRKDKKIINQKTFILEKK